MTIEFDDSELKILFRDIGRDLNSSQIASVLDKEMQFAITDILKRTTSGMDVRRAPFREYSSVTIAQKRAQNVSTGSTVTLQDTGTLHKSLQAVSAKRTGNKTEAQIRILARGYRNSSNTTADVAKKHIRGEGVPVRDFFGLDEQQKIEILKNVETEIFKIFE